MYKVKVTFSKYPNVVGDTWRGEFTEILVEDMADIEKVNDAVGDCVDMETPDKVEVIIEWFAGRRLIDCDLVDNWQEIKRIVVYERNVLKVTNEMLPKCIVSEECLF